MRLNGPVLILDDAGSIPESVETYLRLTKPYETAPRQQLLNHAWIIGGEETIAWETQVEIDRYMDKVFQVAREETQ